MVLGSVVNVREERGKEEGDWVFVFGRKKDREGTIGIWRVLGVPEQRALKLFLLGDGHPI